MTLFTEHQGKWFAFFPRIDAAFHRVLEIAGNPVPSFAAVDERIVSAGACCD